jgi:hypothetical protein
VLSLLPVLVLWASRGIPAAWDVLFKIELSILVLLVSAGLLLPFHWISVVSDGRTLAIRRFPFRTPREVPLADIKRIKIFAQKDRRGSKTRFVGINLNSGPAFDLFLPKRAGAELVAFVNGKMRAAPRP